MEPKFNGFIYLQMYVNLKQKFILSVRWQTILVVLLSSQNCKKTLQYICCLNIVTFTVVVPYDIAVAVLLHIAYSTLERSFFLTNLAKSIFEKEEEKAPNLTCPKETNSLTSRCLLKHL